MQGRIAKEGGGGRRGLARFLHCGAGASAVEFAIVAPVFLLLLMGGVQYGYLLFKMVDMRFQANQFARALAAQAVDATEAQTACNKALKPQGFTCNVTEDATSFSVNITYATSTLKVKFLPQPDSVAYAAYQVKYAVK